MYKILVVEDDRTIANSVKDNLIQWGFDAEISEDFNHVMEQFLRYDPQLILLDINLPMYNGYHWCTQIRKVSKVPIIFLSSRNDNMNIVMAMNMGADDFISKPFDLIVLVAKIQALLRRTYDFQGESNVLEHKGAMLNLKNASLTYQEQKLDLTKNEFRIMETLMENKGKIVSRDTIMMKLWDSECFIDDNTLTVNVTRLRKKLEEVGLTNFILTKKGVGYYIDE